MNNWELIGIYDSHYDAPKLSGYIRLIEKDMVAHHDDIPPEIYAQATKHQVIALCVVGEKEDILSHLRGEIDIEFDSSAVGFDGSSSTYFSQSIRG